MTTILNFMNITFSNQVTPSKLISTFEDCCFSINSTLMAHEIEMQICLGSSCFSRGNKELVIFIKEYLKKNHLEDKVIFKGARCMGNCSNGPNLKIGNVKIEEVTLATLEGILEKELSRLK